MDNFPNNITTNDFTLKEGQSSYVVSFDKGYHIVTIEIISYVTQMNKSIDYSLIVSTGTLTFLPVNH